MDIFKVEQPLVGDPSRVHLLKRVLDLSNPETRLLDVGCGTGALWKPLMEEIELELWGIDIDPARIKIAKTIVKNKDKITEGSVHSLSRMFSAAFFDIVVSTQVFYLVKHLRRALEEIQFVLRPGGKLLFTTELPKVHPSLLSRMTRGYTAVKGFITRQDMPQRRDENELSRLLEEAGFQIESVKLFHIPPLKFIHNNLISDMNKNRVMHRWLELEEELGRDTNFLREGKRYCRNLFIEAVKRG